MSNVITKTEKVFENMSDEQMYYTLRLLGTLANPHVHKILTYLAKNHNSADLLFFSDERIQVSKVETRLALHRMQQVGIVEPSEKLHVDGGRYSTYQISDIGRKWVERCHITSKDYQKFESQKVVTRT